MTLNSNHFLITFDWKKKKNFQARRKNSGIYMQAKP